MSYLYEGMYASQHDLITLEMKDHLLDHFDCIILDAVIIYES